LHATLQEEQLQRVLDFVRDVGLQGLHQSSIEADEGVGGPNIVHGDIDGHRQVAKGV
jgi:hypothetical protein